MQTNLNKSELDFIRGRRSDAAADAAVSAIDLENNPIRSFPDVIAGRISGLGIAIVFLNTMIEFAYLITKNI